jgi:hypothetical protein
VTKTATPYASGPFTFDWAVDQKGYLIDGSFIRPVGGPPRYYRPLDEHPDLWLRFANTCSSPEGVLAFANEFGLLIGFYPFSAAAIANPSPQTGPFDRASGASQVRAEIAWEQLGRLPHDFQAHDIQPSVWSESVGFICERAEVIRRIASDLGIDPATGNRVDAEDRIGAARTINDHNLRVRHLLERDERSGRFEIRVVPLSLHDALLHQASETVVLNHRWRRCSNNGCPNWWRLGAPKGTARKEYCSDRCRVASARKHKHQETSGA